MHLETDVHVHVGIKLCCWNNFENIWSNWWYGRYDQGQPCITDKMTGDLNQILLFTAYNYIVHCMYLEIDVGIILCGWNN
jgi:hypothetical protein